MLFRNQVQKFLSISGVWVTKRVLLPGFSFSVLEKTRRFRKKKKLNGTWEQRVQKKKNQFILRWPREMKYCTVHSADLLADSPSFFLSFY